MKENFDKVYEQSLEESILAAILVCDGDSVRDFILKHNLIPSDFQYGHHQQLFQAIMKCWNDGHQVNLVSISAYKPNVSSRNWDYSNTLISEKHISVATLEHSMLKFKEFRLARYWTTKAQIIQDFNWNGKDLLAVSNGIAQQYQTLFDRLTKDIKGANADSYEAEMTQKYINKQSGVAVAIPTGCDELDTLLKGGLSNGELIILAGRPGMLKTTIALSMAWEAHKRGHAVVFFSLEMPESQLKTKIICKELNLDYNKVKAGDFSTDELGLITQWSKRIDDSNFTIIDSLKEMDAIYRETIRLNKEGLCDIAFCDYLQLAKNYNKELRLAITYNTREMKSLSKEAKIPFIALSQLSRGVEHRDNKRPFLSDLKESGSIEEDADVVIFPYRDAYYQLKIDPTRNIPRSEMWKTELNIAKGRDIGIGGAVFDISPITLEINSWSFNL